MNSKVANQILALTCVLPQLCTVRASWAAIPGEVTRTVLIEFGKKQVDASIGDVTKYFWPVVTVGCYVAQYKRTTLYAMPNQPIIKTEWVMTMDHNGKCKWERTITTNGIKGPVEYVDSNTPGVKLHFWTKRCPYVHDSKTYPNDLTEEFVVCGRARVENYATLIKDRRPDSVSYEATTRAYRLKDPCIEPVFHQFDSNRVDVTVSAIGQVNITTDGIGYGPWAFFSPTPFLSYNHAVQLNQIFIGKSGGH